MSRIHFAAIVILCALLSVPGSICLSQVPMPSPAPSGVTAPMVDLSGTQDDNTDPTIRHGRAVRENNPTGHVLTELPKGVEPYPLMVPWTSRVPAIPISQSDLVVIGKVDGAKVFLSDDKHGVYSEFSVTRDRILKDQYSVAQNHVLILERAGGAVKFPSGRISQLRVNQQGFPVVGHEYLFFLKFHRNTQDFYILTAYDLTSGKVHALDGHDSSEPLQFAQYEGADVATFIAGIAQQIGVDAQSK